MDWLRATNKPTNRTAVALRLGRQHEDLYFRIYDDSGSFRGKLLGPTVPQLFGGFATALSQIVVVAQRLRL
jgi:hypothetical protein